MKKKWVIIAILAVLVIAIAVAVLTFVLSNRSPAEERPDETTGVSFVNTCWNHVTEVTYVEQEDGTVEVTLTAPDYVRLIELMAEDDVESITEERMAQVIEDNSNVVKMYSFTAASSEKTDVQTALMEQITYELIALTLEDMMGGLI